MNVSLVMVTEDGSSREFPVSSLPAVIGRGDEAKIRVPVGSVSRRHCELLIDDDELAVRDLGSSNGTWVNGVRVKSRELVPGDLLAVGPLVFVVRIDGHPRDVDARGSFIAGTVPQEGAPPASGVPAFGSAGAADDDDEDDLLAGIDDLSDEDDDSDIEIDPDALKL